MLIPIIANVPLSGPSIAMPPPNEATEGREDNAPGQDTKDAFGTLFRTNSIPKAVRTPDAEIATTLAETETLPDAGSEAEIAEAPALVDALEPETAQPGAASEVTEIEREDDETPLHMPAAPQSIPVPPQIADASDVDVTPSKTTEANARMGPEQVTLPARQEQVMVIGNTEGSVTQRAFHPTEGSPPDPLRGAATVAQRVTRSDGPRQDPKSNSRPEPTRANDAAQDLAVKPERPIIPVNQPPQAPPATPFKYSDPADLIKTTASEITKSETEHQPLVFEARPTTVAAGTGVNLTQAFLQRPELPHNIAMQLAVAAKRGDANRPIDLILSPAELGPVRLSMSSLDGVMSVTVIAERPETLDLMRRHIETLAQEFLNIGYGKAQFSFGGGHSDQAGQSRPGQSTSKSRGFDSQADLTDTPILHQRPVMISDRLDIRL